MIKKFTPKELSECMFVEIRNCVKMFFEINKNKKQLDKQCVAWMELGFMSAFRRCGYSKEETDKASSLLHKLLEKSKF